MNPTSVKTRRRRLLAAATFLVFSAAVSAAAVIAAEGTKLYLNGKVASSDMRTIGGNAYVRVSDIAKAFNLSAVRRSDGSYELTKAGGANQVEGMEGNIGDVLFTGKWRVTALGLETPGESYTMKSQGDPYGTALPITYNSVTRVIRPTQGHTLVVIRCRLSNGQKSPQTLWIAARESRTALTDAQGESYPVCAYDVDGAPIQTKSLPPGAKIEIPLVFSVPQGAVLQDFVFTANNNDETKAQKGNDIRVHLR